MLAVTYKSDCNSLGKGVAWMHRALPWCRWQTSKELWVMVMGHTNLSDIVVDIYYKLHDKKEEVEEVSD